MDYEIDVIFEAENEFLPSQNLVINLVSDILKEHKAKRAEVSIAFVQDAEIIDLNQKYFKKTTPTDVISFNLLEDTNYSDVLAYSNLPAKESEIIEKCLIETPLVEGEIIVNADEAKRSAADYGNTHAQEVLIYVIHGLLHILGYDDLEEEKKRIMWIFQNHYFEKFVLSAGS